jgi:hypothetical protein
VNRFRDTVTINVPLPADEAMALFTARGERRWVEDWDPEFPAGEPSEEGEGTVFVTRANGRSTYWVVAVEVRRRRSDARSTQVKVTYDLSALTAQGAAELDVFAARYDQEIGAWEAAIGMALANESGP